LKNTDGYFCGQPDTKVSDISSIYFIKQRYFFPPFVIFMACFAHRRNSSGMA